MIIKNVFPKDIHVEFEMSLGEVKALERTLKGARFFPRGEEEQGYADIVANKLYPDLKKLVEELEEDGA